MSNKQLISINKDTNVLLNKSKDLLDITKNIFTNRCTYYRIFKIKRINRESTRNIKYGNTK